MDEHAQHSTELVVGIREVDLSLFQEGDSEGEDPAEFQAQLDQEKITQILQEFLPMIRRMAGAMALKNPFSLDVEDLTSAGAMGLLSALKRFDPSRDIKFRTFAEYRIRGMMLDEIRAMDWVPRSVRSRRDQIRQIVEEHLQKNGTPPTTQELAHLLGISAEEIEGIGGCDPRLISLDEPVGQGEEVCTLRDVLPDVDHQDPFVACADAEMKSALNAAIVTLSKRQQEVLKLYYHTGLTMKEIGSQLGLTESGVCRVHSGALRHLRIELERIEDGGSRVRRPKNLRKMQVP
ncbi:MAG: FliA/WhiG family RNA polymerase sigma factor [Nitrospirota bacterium]|nr:FliA/WhiG family RNA polymerase sigma factor [Nitrospirota bacterium]MDH4359735.1 FliA/WhiG family RNA polymerase sigma factor [Nitrospirota bacterium]MDH5574009.1 FliA/WhiG family RNA polymerase sigma factor [Nitrospirota bacterium]